VVKINAELVHGRNEPIIKRLEPDVGDEGVVKQLKRLERINYSHWVKEQEPYRQ
jgi:hypothetical protein